MSYKWLVSSVIISFFACLPAQDLTKAIGQPAPKECIAPPMKYKEVQLAQCQSNEHYFCCAYPFLVGNDQLCLHVLCQPLADCSTSWKFYGTECPPVETNEAPKEKSIDYDSDFDEGWSEAG